MRVDDYVLGDESSSRHWFPKKREMAVSSSIGGGARGRTGRDGGQDLDEPNGFRVKFNGGVSGISTGTADVW